LEDLDRELNARYDESDLAGMKVGHALDAFQEEETVLTLKDKRLLDDDEDDELVNVNIDEQTRTEMRLDLKKKGKQLGQYTAFDDDEFVNDIGKKRSILSKYDTDINDSSSLRSTSLGFVLGASAVLSGQQGDAAATFEAVSQPVSRTAESRQVVAKELTKTLSDVSRTGRCAIFVISHTDWSNVSHF